MDSKRCPSCGEPMKRNGKSRSGSQRWRCRACGASATHGNDVAARDLGRFVSWLLSKGAQADMPGGGRTFRRRTAGFWELWPMPDVVDEVHRVVFVDGIWIARDCVVLIACSDEFVLSWHLARSETKRAWQSLLSRIAPPDMVVTDGGSGFAAAVSEEWPRSRVQRCTFHAFSQVKRYTTSRPKLQAGIELYGLACDLLHVRDLGQAQRWSERFVEWCGFWSDFLEERSVVDGRMSYTHERLRKARRSLASPLSSGTLFAYLDPNLAAEGPLPATNNRIEGAVNAQIRCMLRNHRGLSTLRRAKAAFWWCAMHVECPKDMAQILREMPTDADVGLLRSEYGIDAESIGKPAKWGEGLVWEELHFKTRYPYAID